MKTSDFDLNFQMVYESQKLIYYNMVTIKYFNFVKRWFGVVTFFFLNDE